MADVEELERALRGQLAHKPARLAHSLGVAGCARDLALSYGVDEEDAYVAGLIHDWGKAYDDEEVVRRANLLGIDMGDDLLLVAPLLHGPVAAAELAERFPELSRDILTAIERHTIGCAQMKPLDMVVFVADAIEPGRPSHAGIELLREQVGIIALDELFWLSFRQSVSHVIDTGRYLYPGTLAIYNELALAWASREQGKESAWA